MQIGKPSEKNGVRLRQGGRGSVGNRNNLLLERIIWIRLELCLQNKYYKTNDRY
jgi:hypothetical protein